MDFRNQGQGNANMEVAEIEQLYIISEESENAEDYSQLISNSEHQVREVSGLDNSCPVEIDAIARAAMELGSEYEEKDPSYIGKVNSIARSLEGREEVKEIGESLYQDFNVKESLDSSRDQALIDTGKMDDASFVA